MMSQCGEAIPVHINNYFFCGSDNAVIKYGTEYLKQNFIKTKRFEELQQRTEDHITSLPENWVEEKVMFLNKTIRSGQSISYSGSIIIQGDVSSGAEVYAGKNLIVLGTIRGSVFAGFNNSRNSFIIAFRMQPEILGISDMISRSPDVQYKEQHPEIARIVDNHIVLEPYSMEELVV